LPTSSTPCCSPRVSQSGDSSSDIPARWPTRVLWRSVFRNAWHSGGVTRTQYFTATSLDGYIADENNSLDWLFEVDRAEGDDSFTRFFADVGAMAMGATTYEWVLDHERLLDHPEKWRAYYGETPCWVFTHRPLPLVPGTDIRIVEGDPRPVHQEMTQAAGDRNIWLVGGGDLVGQFSDWSLLDEILLGVAPVTLGAGAPLLPRRLTAADLELVDVVRDKQFVRLSYRLRR
jgi:dihydrofolate reductase